MSFFTFQTIAYLVDCYDGNISKTNIKKNLREIEKKLEEVKETNRQNLQFGIKGRPTKKNRRNLDGFKFN